MDANRAIAPSLMLELHAGAPCARWGRSSTRALSALAERGFRFSMDHVTDLRMEPRDLAERGIPLRQGAGGASAQPGGNAPSDIHAGDLSDLLARFGISLIAERIETEAHGGRPARLRRALRAGLPVLAAAAGARRGAAGRRRREADERWRATADAVSAPRPSCRRFDRRAPRSPWRERRALDRPPDRPLLPPC